MSDDERCSDVGVEILKESGNAVDAAIAVAFCMGVVNPHITGLGRYNFQFFEKVFELF